MNFLPCESIDIYIYIYIYMDILTIIIFGSKKKGHVWGTKDVW